MPVFLPRWQMCAYSPQARMEEVERWRCSFICQSSATNPLYDLEARRVHEEVL
jgi:hypothetical protein